VVSGMGKEAQIEGEGKREGVEPGREGCMNKGRIGTRKGSERGEDRNERRVAFLATTGQHVTATSRRGCREGGGERWREGGRERWREGGREGGGEGGIDGRVLTRGGGRSP